MSTHISIRVSCTKLKNKDLMSKSDPCCVLYKKEDDEWVEVGRTETIQNNLNPLFQQSFEVEYIFDEVQMVRFEVYDIDNKSEKLDDDDFLGQVETTVAEIVSGSPLTLELIDKKKAKPAGGTITLRSMECSTQAGSEAFLRLSFRAQKLDKKDTFSKSDPFLEFYRKTLDDQWEVVHRTEVVKNNLNPTWEPFKVKAHVLCGGDYKNPIKVKCLDWDSNGKNDYIGSFETSVAELIAARSGKEWFCIDETKVGKKKYENSGVIILTSCELLKD